jgi:multimeric flavodoxin WrbA
MKKIYAINGSPRKNKNTATLLDKVLEGAKKPILMCWQNGSTFTA